MHRTRLVAAAASCLLLLAAPAAALPGPPQNLPVPGERGGGAGPVHECLADRDAGSPEDDASDEEAPDEDAPEDEAPDEEAPEDALDEDAPEEDAPAEEATSSLLPMDADDGGDAERETGGDGGDGPGFDEETQERDGTPSEDPEDDRIRDVPEREADDGRRGPPEGTVGACVLEALPDIVGNTHAASIVALVERGIAGGTLREDLLAR